MLSEEDSGPELTDASVNRASKTMNKVIDWDIYYQSTKELVVRRLEMHTIYIYWSIREFMWDQSGALQPHSSIHKLSSTGIIMKSRCMKYWQCGLFKRKSNEHG